MNFLRRAACILISATLIFIAPLGCGEKEYSTLTRTVFSSGIVFSATLYGGNATAALNEMSAIIDEVDGSVNVQNAATPLSRFNAANVGEKIEVDKHAYYLASESKRLYTLTDAAFNVSLGDVSTAWSVDVNGIMQYCYTNTFPQSLPSRAQLAALSSGTDLSALDVIAEDGKYYLSKRIDGLTLDLGGIAKGYCTDLCRDVAKKHGVKSGLIQLSGNIILIGNNEQDGKNEPWGVGVNNPRLADNNARHVCGFYESDCGVATSGDYERYYTYRSGNTSFRVSHIINGKTLCPVGVTTSGNEYVQEQSYVISATVVGESSMLCDVYATAVCVLGLQKGSELLQSQGYKGIIFTSDKKMRVVGDFALDENTTLYTEYAAV